MADDAQWPSEEEDFDATIDKASKSTTATVTKKVQVSDDPGDDSAENNDAQEDASTENESATDSSDSENETSEADANEEAPVEPETSDEQSSEPESDTEPETASSSSDTPNNTIPAAAVTAASASPKKGVSKGRLAFEIVLVLLVIGLGLWSWTLYSDKQNLESQVAKLNSNPQIVLQKQSQALITKVGKLLDLPKNESPTIATVSDANAARKQSVFFTNAQNGDKVLMYVKAGEAILYRPSTNKIILVGPLTFNNNSSTSTSSNKASTSSTSTTPKSTTTNQ